MAKTSKRGASTEAEKKETHDVDGEGIELLAEDEVSANTDETDCSESNEHKKRTGQSDEDNGVAPCECGEAMDVTIDVEMDTIAKMEEKLAAERDRYLRLAAEYDNFRKRSAKEREMTYNDARADAITRLLPVYDNLERALKAECTDDVFYKGVEMTMTQLTDIFENMGVSPIPAVGEVFDPNRHNAVSNIDNPEYGEKTVAEEYQKGFTLGERVLRFSTVVVAN